MERGEAMAPFLTYTMWTSFYSCHMAPSHKAITPKFGGSQRSALRIPVHEHMSSEQGMSIQNWYGFREWVILNFQNYLTQFFTDSYKDFVLLVTAIKCIQKIVFRTNFSLQVIAMITKYTQGAPFEG